MNFSLYISFDPYFYEGYNTHKSVDQKSFGRTLVGRRKLKDFAHKIPSIIENEGRNLIAISDYGSTKLGQSDFLAHAV